MSRRDQGGYVLFTVVVMLVIVAVGTLLVSYDSSLKASMPAGEAEASRADYVAEAAMQHALWQSANSACMGGVTIPTTALGSDSYTAAITGAAAGTAYTLTADQDTWILNDQPTTNYGSDTDLRIEFSAGTFAYSLYRFDLSSLPPGAQINSASASFYVKPGGIHPEGPVTVHAVTADWTEAGATWDNMSSNFDSAALAMIPAQSQADVRVNINLTAQVQAWVNGQPNFGVLLASRSEGVVGKYRSRETGTASESPGLEVVVGSGPASPVNIQATGTLVNGTTRTLSRPLTAALQPPVIHTLRPDAAASEDAEIWAQRTNNNYGDAAETWVSSASNDTTRSLLRFNLGAIPTHSRVLGATLILYRQSGSGADQPVSAHRIVNSWSEGSVTWNSRDSSANWDTAGGDFDNMAVATTPVGPVNEPYEWDITPLVQSWVDGSYPNYGVAMVAAIDGMAGERFYTSDQAVLDRRPSLSVTYACECGSACMAPNGSGVILMVVINPTTLVAEDAFKKALFESWGYAVDVLSESANQAAYDAAITTSEVVFISDTVNSNQVGTKLVNAAIGVVSQDGDYNADLGFATGSASPVGSTINISDNSHYITLPFASGPLNVYSAAMQGLAVAGAPAPGLQTLGDWSGSGGPVVLDAGAAMSGGGTAAGRRVLLPIGGVNIDFAHVNNDGLLIMQRALAWGMNADAGASGNLLLVVGNAGSPSSGELDRKALIESWGYTVTLIDDGDSQANFDTALAANDVVYVSGDVSATTVGTKLTAAAIGIVNEETLLTVELGFSDDTGSENRNEIEILDNTHSITSGFALGMTTIVTSMQPLTFVNNGAAPGAQVLAQTNQVASFFEPSLLILEMGSELSGGGFAAGKRVSLPWGDIGFDFSALNANGLMIMKRAIEWAAGAGVNALAPIAHWKLDDGAGPAAVDSMGNNDGTLVDNPAWVAGKIGDALDFDGVNDYVDAGSFDVSGNGLTLMSWFKAETIPTSDGRFISKASGGNDFDAWWQLSTTDSGSNRYLRMRVKAGGTTTTFADSSVNLQTGQWYFAVGTYDNATGDMRLYLDGAEVASGAHSVGGPVDTSPTVPVAIGANGTAERFFDGVLDDVRVYDRALNAAEIADLYTEGVGDALVAHWKLDDGTGLTAIDSVGGHDGTLTGGPTWVAGQLGDALDFDGVNDYVDVGTFDVSGSGLTLMGWFNAETISTLDGRIVSKAHGGSDFNAWWQLSTTDSGSNRFIRMRVKAGGTTTTFADSSVNLQTGQWYFAVGTYDNATGDMRLYLDGTEVASGTHAVGGSVDTSPTVPVAIGANGTAERYFDGILDDVRIYDRALNATEISDLFTAGGGGGGGNPDANFGFDTIFSSSQRNVRRKQIATQVTLPEDGMATSITAYVGGKNARNVRYAIYSDVAGEPGALLAETPNALTTTAMDWLTIDLSATPLTAGTYWLALSFHDRNQKYHYDSGGKIRYNNNRATDNGFTANWGSSTDQENRSISIYATYTPD